MDATHLSQAMTNRNLELDARADAVTDRSKQAFEQLYDRSARRLLVHLVRRMQDVDAATELWAECWAVAFAGWSRCRATSPEEAEAWLFGIAHRQLAGYYRKGAVRRRVLERLQWSVPEVSEDDHDELERDAELAELRELLSAALATLPEMRRRAVELRVLGALPYPQVAARMGCSEQAARAHVSRGLRQLQRLIDLHHATRPRGATR